MKYDKQSKRLALAAIAAAACWASNVQAQQSAGIWNFDAGTLAATKGSPLGYADGAGGATQTGTSFGTTTSFGIPNIGGTAAQVMKFPATGPDMGYSIPTPAAANGGGSLVNNWSIVFDLLFPIESDGKWRALMETDGRQIQVDADLAINPGNGIGTSGNYSGAIAANTWYRVGFVLDGEKSTIRKYINGVLVGSQATDGLDGRWALSPAGTATLFTDDSNETATGYVNSIAIYDGALNNGQMAALGAASAAGVPVVMPAVAPFIATSAPNSGASNVTPTPAISVALNRGDATVTQSSIKLYLDGTDTAATVTEDSGTYTVAHEVTRALEPNSIHEIAVVYNSSVGTRTNSFRFTVANFQNITLPAPIFLQTFDDLEEAALPAGWVATNLTSLHVEGFDLGNLRSEAYEDWVVVDTDRLRGLKSRIYEKNDIYLNGEVVESLSSGKVLYAESDVRSANQVQAITTADYNLSGKQNIFLSFKSMYEQNQDSLGAVEYSIDGGANWLPLLYMVDDKGGNQDVVRKPDGTIDAVATLSTARANQAWALAYGAYIAAPITASMAPFISGRIDDDRFESKRIEVLRVAGADNQARVRFRFLYTGTASWYWGIDDLGLYSINLPLLTTQPASQTVSFGENVTFQVVASVNPPFTYQWFFKGGQIVGETTDTLNLTAVDAGDEGDYKVVVRNSEGAVTSNTAILTVVVAPKITSQPKAVLASAGAAVTLSVASQGQPPLSYQWYKNDAIIDTAKSASYAINAATEAAEGNYKVVISNASGTATSDTVAVMIQTGSITEGLIGHYKFEANANDSSGRDNHGVPAGQEETASTLPTFESGGIIGNALRVTEGEYVSLAGYTDFEFGDATDFTVSMWVKGGPGSMEGDPSFFGNKNWASGGNPGFVVALSGGGYKWNWDGSGGPRRDTGAIGNFSDGNWHNILVSHDRDGVAYFYWDGILSTTIPIANDGDINALAFNLLQDGTGAYGFANDRGARFHDIRVDDVGIWSRLLTPQEASSIYAKGLSGQDLTTATFTGANPPSITTAPVSKTVTAGLTTTLTVAASGTPPFTYQWKKGNEVVGTEATLTLSNVSAASAGTYTVTVSNSAGATTSAPVTITVAPAPPVIITGQWDFDNGDLAATAGTALQYRGDIAAGTTFSTVTIDGQPAKVMKFPAATKAQGYIIPHGASPNGDGTLVNRYTLILDVMFPTESHNKWRGLWQTDPSNNSDGDLFVNNGNGIGISGQYQGAVVPEKWHRIAFVVDLNARTIGKFIDGALVNLQTISSGVDGRFSLNPTALLFTDEDGETATGFVNSIQFRNGTMTDAEIAALGGATAGGIPGAAAPLKINSITRAGNNVTLNWNGAAGVKLQRTASLTNPSWQDVAGTDGQSATTVDATPATGFFRLIRN